MTAPIDTITTDRRGRIRVPPAKPTGLIGAAVRWYCRRLFGDIPDPVHVMAHHRPVLLASAAYERRIESWHELDPDLKDLAVLATASTIGCSWCIDFGTFIADRDGRDVDRFRDVPRWHDSTAFSDLERSVLTYAEAMTATPPSVTDPMVDELVASLGVPAVVELTKMVAVENERSRFNAAMGLTSQGFSDTCAVPKP